MLANVREQLRSETEQLYLIGKAALQASIRDENVTGEQAADVLPDPPEHKLLMHLLYKGVETLPLAWRYLNYRFAHDGDEEPKYPFAERCPFHWTRPYLLPHPNWTKFRDIWYNVSMDMAEDHLEEVKALRQVADLENGIIVPDGDDGGSHGSNNNMEDKMRGDNGLLGSLLLADEDMQLFANVPDLAPRRTTGKGHTRRNEEPTSSDDDDDGDDGDAADEKKVGQRGRLRRESVKVRIVAAHYLCL
jgi:hypothetical protein